MHVIHGTETISITCTGLCKAELADSTGIHECAVKGKKLQYSHAHDCTNNGLLQGHSLLQLVLLNCTANYLCANYLISLSSQSIWLCGFPSSES